MQNDIPYIAYEAAQARSERCIRRLIILCLVLVSMLFASNLAWLLFIDQYEVVGEAESISMQAADGHANFIAGNGEIDNGEYNDKANENDDTAQIGQ